MEFYIVLSYDENRHVVVRGSTACPATDTPGTFVYTQACLTMARFSATVKHCGERQHEYMVQSVSDQAWTACSKARRQSKVLAYDW